jgi:hypothetical protein
VHALSLKNGQDKQTEYLFDIVSSEHNFMPLATCSVEDLIKFLTFSAKDASVSCSVLKV